ncbi:MAG TPA: hypothetical protein VIC28_14695 [Thermoanaerobaculia bacterium]
MKRIAIAAIVGGLIVFVWSAISHMLLPLGEMGISTLPNEAAVLETLKTSIPQSGLYFFPTPTDPSAANPAGPAGIMVFHPEGGMDMSPKRLGNELLSNVLAALVAAWIASLLAAAYGRRVLAIALLGLFGWLSLIVSYWIWYGYPAAYILGEGINEVVGWFLAGLAIAKIVPPAIIEHQDANG